MATKKASSNKATKAVASTKEVKKEANKIYAYDMKTKEKNQEMKNAVVDVNIKGERVSYIAKGTSPAGNKMAAIITKDTAEAAIKAGNAKKGEGWPKKSK